MLSVDKAHHDFGKMEPDKNATHRFIITNKGNAPLHIMEVRESCNCSKATMPKPRLAPGESTFIEIRFSSHGMKGNVQKSIELVSDDPINPKTQLTFEASVVYEIIPSTSMILFSEVSRYGSATASIRLQSGDTSPVTIKEVRMPVPYLSCETKREGNDIILNVKIDGPLVPIASSKGIDAFTVHTSSVKFPKFKFSVHWDTLPIITASPKRIVWEGAAGQELRTTISLKHSGAKAFKILKAKTTSPHIKISNPSRNDTAEQEINVTLASSAKIGMYQEKIILKLNDPLQKELEIGISAILR